MTLLLLLLVGGCASDGGSLTDAERRAIADTLQQIVRRAYDVSTPGWVDRLLALYPDTGRVVSASGGGIVTSRDSLAEGTRYFWESMGRNMQQPRWVWERFLVDVLDQNGAALTGLYRVPHRTPAGTPHEIAGVMTLVFARRSGRWVVVQEHISDLPPAAQPAPAMPGDTGRPSG